MSARKNRAAFALSGDGTLSIVEGCWRSEDATVLESKDCFESQRDCVIGQAFAVASARTGRGVVRCCLGG
jgi:hypothetical protein